MTAEQRARESWLACGRRRSKRSDHLFREYRKDLADKQKDPSNQDPEEGFKGIHKQINNLVAVNEYSNEK